MRIRHRSSWLRTRIARRFAFIVAAIVACQTLLGSARAAPIEQFTFTLGGLDTGTGTLTATDSGLGDGSLLVTSGTLNLTASSGANGSQLGTYVITPIGPTPSGCCDDLLYPANNAGSGVYSGGISNPSYLDNYGLDYVPGGSAPGSASLIDIWGNGSGNYGVGSFSSYDNGGVTFALTQVLPEPHSVVALCGLGAMGLFFAIRRHRKGTG
jgi:hypothetical protein